MNSIWAIARHTFVQCLRMKIAIAFLLLLAGSLAILPFVMKGDGTLGGSIRTCLSYSVKITGVLLSVVTVLITVGVVSGDIREKHIFLLISKPLPRWQYMIGRWFGVVMLNAVLLGISGMSIYFVVQHLRSGLATSAIDRQVVETEIFTARHEEKPSSPKIIVQSMVEKRIKKLKETKQYEGIINDFQVKGNISTETAKKMLVSQLEKEALTKLEVAPPNGWLKWTFKNIDVAGVIQQGRGKILLLNKQRGLYRIEAPVWVAGQLFREGPVEINGVEGKVLGIGEDKKEGQFDVGFKKTDLDNPVVKDFQKDQDVDIVIEPTFQFRYKVTPIGKMGGKNTVFRVLEFRKAKYTASITRVSESPINTLISVTVPAVKNLRKGDIEVRYGNIPKPQKSFMQIYSPINPVQISHEDVSILYKIGGFDANFFRAMLLVFCQLVFLAGLGIFFGGFLSFPVASLACLVLLVCGWMMNWMGEAVSWSSRDGGIDIIGGSGKIVLLITEILMPNLSETSPAERLVDGIFIPWTAVARAAVTSIAIRTVFFLAVGCLIFHKRELAKVQV